MRRRHVRVFETLLPSVSKSFKRNQPRPPSPGNSQLTALQRNEAGVCIQAFILYPWHEVVSKEIRALELKDSELKKRIRELRERDEQFERRVEDLMNRFGVQVNDLAGAAHGQSAVVAHSEGDNSAVRNAAASKPWYKRLF